MENAQKREEGNRMAANRRAAGRLSVCALMCALLSVCAQIQIPLPGVPLSLALFAVHLCALLLPPRQAVMSLCAYLLLGLCGVPVFAGFACGPAALLGPTGGFLFAYPLSALLSSTLAARLGRRFSSLFLCALAGNALCMTLGVCWFLFVSGTPLTLPSLAYWLLYLPGDLIKIALACALAIRLYPQLKNLCI